MSQIRKWLNESYELSFVNAPFGSKVFDRYPSELEIAIFIEKYFPSGEVDGNPIRVKIEKTYSLK